MVGSTSIMKTLLFPARKTV